MFFSLSLDLLCIADMNGRFRRLYRSWEATLGYSTDELIGQEFIRLVHPDDIDATLAVIAAMDEDHPALSFVNRYRTREGNYRHIEWHATVNENHLIYAAARDITERVEQEKQFPAADLRS